MKSATKCKVCKFSPSLITLTRASDRRKLYQLECKCGRRGYFADSVDDVVEEWNRYQKNRKEDGEENKAELC